MDKIKQKPRKEKPMKHVEKGKSQSFITDVKTLKENLKIREILRTVKMNSSMRIKAPRGSKVMTNKDFNDNENDGLFADCSHSDNHDISDLPSAINPNVVFNNVVIDKEETIAEVTDSRDINESIDSPAEDISRDIVNDEYQNIDENENENGLGDTNAINIKIHRSNSVSEGLVDFVVISDTMKSVETTPELRMPPSPNDDLPVKTRDRKMSLDHTILTRREGLSQSELDLHSIGKSPLERKSSFFRKKMDSFLKNTTEIFKRQSLGSKSQTISRRGSMSVSLQSLNENSTYNDDLRAEQLHKMHPNLQDSTTSLQSSMTGRSNSSISVGQSDLLAPDQQSEGSSFAGSQPGLVSSQPLADISSNSINSLDEVGLQESLLNRAISMSSGLDSARGVDRRKANRSNRVTWVASEGLTNYFRRVIQAEKSRELQGCPSYQDFSTIPENNFASPKTDSKGRRLSYQRAVSGEDPVPLLRYQDSSLRRKPLIPENYEANYELASQLADFSEHGVPSLTGFYVTPIPDEAFAYLLWAEKPANLEDFYDWKQLTPNEEARQAVIRELVFTEADYLRHLIAIVEVFIAAAHALQDSGKLLDVETEKLFCNIPDVLNASLLFWEITLFPMVVDAVTNTRPFNTELMSSGFCRFRELFQPYEKYVCDQTKVLDYLRSLSNNSDFMTYLSWCHSQKSCNRLQLSDIMVKPMQRLTKYSLILRRIIAHTDSEPEKTSLIAMESAAKNYVLELNRSIRQKEELEKLDRLANSIETFEIDFKDEEMDRYFKMYAQLNLKAPMHNCLPTHSRSLIHQGDLRFKDNAKEIDVRVFLLTDMMLICKKLNKGGIYTYKLIRPKYMIERMVTFPRYSTRNNKELIGLICVIVDEVTSSYQCFALSESSKDNSPGSIKLWEQKIKEARLTYDLAVWFGKNPSRDLSELEIDTSSEYALATSGQKLGMKQNSDDLNIEREARERVAAMSHRSMGASTECDFSQASMNTDSVEGNMASGGRPPGLNNLRHPLQRNSTGSSRNSRLSSFQKSTSATSHDEPQAGPSKYNYVAGSSVEHLIPPLNPEDSVTSITVNVVSESETETLVPKPSPPPPPPPPVVVLQQPTPQKTAPRSVSSGQNTLRVQPQSGVMALVHSLPDLTIDPSPSPPRPSQSPSPQSASEKLYQSHQELLQRNRLQAQQQHQYLSPNHRGTSYPLPSPTRASLKRGLAFSYSFKNPPLTKMGHVNSQSQLQAEAGPSTSQGTKNDKGAVNPMMVPSTSTDKGDKKAKHVTSKNKSGDPSPVRKEDKGD
ncbi:hypothetical protein K1T71_000152 [Dendrolimus kikuchii]|uniref:Uncharacterized protein n=1 Tax=Dendrolimus kikuchii TaxID=765133 RepID=A0ACC1DJ27_9NEOP|nr:hypothetical protein K1T71_000152 [Dendrolimus kikuchii]